MRFGWRGPKVEECLFRNLLAVELVWSKLSAISQSSPVDFWRTRKLWYQTHMSGMPLARIYASSVEEAEPLRADLFARGYNVQVVFPDAELTEPADLELRLEHCSPAQAIARVEAVSGSPSRCVFITPSRIPQRDLVLIEMTVAAAGTESRHPQYVPDSLLVANLAIAGLVVPPVEARAEKVNPPPLVVLPFPASETAATYGAAPAQTDRRSPSKDLSKQNNDDWDKVVGAEVTAFLAHAPRVEPAKFFPERILSDIQRSQLKSRIQKYWEGMALVGVASGILMLLYISWHVGPSQPTSGSLHAAASTESPVAPVQEPGVRDVTPAPSPIRQSVADQSAGQSMVRATGDPKLADQLIARDTVIHVVVPTRRALIAVPISSAGNVLVSKVAADRTTPIQSRPFQNNPFRSNPVQSSSAGPGPLQKQFLTSRPAPIKKITDLN